MTSPRDAILDAVVSKLRLIGAANGTTWATSKVPQAMRLRTPGYEVTTFPTAIVMGGDESYALDGSSGAWRTYQKTLRVSVSWWQQSADMDRDASSVIHDVELALRDRQLSGTCSDMVIESNRVLLTELQKPTFVVEFVLVVVYDIAENVPGTRI